MLLKKLQIENLRSYENQTIEFPSGSTLLSGDIGAGKTTILLAIEFALFGLQPSQKGSSLLRNNKDNAKVTLEFAIENKNIMIERTLKKTSKSISQDQASITIDNEKTEASITEVKNKILNLLNYPSEFAKKTNLLYKFTVYTPQEEMKQIILEPADLRLNTLRHVFGIDKYKKIQENTSILTSKLREKTRINEALISELDNDKENLNDQKQNLEQLKQKQTQTEQNYQKSQKNREEKEQSLKQVEEKISEKKSLETEKEKSDLLIIEKTRQITNLNNDIKNLTIQIQEAKKTQFDEEEYNALDQRIQFQQNKEDDLQKEYLDAISKINSNQSRRDESEQLITKISKLDKCPTCLQQVSEEYRNNIMNTANQELQQINKNIEKLTEQKKQLTEQLEQTKKIKEQFKERKSTLEILKIKIDALKEKENKITEIEIQKQSLQNNLQDLQKNLFSLQESIKQYEKYEDLFKQRESELNQAKQQENQEAIKKAEINKEIQFTKQQIQKTKQEIKNKEQIQKQTEKIKQLEDWLSTKFLDIILFIEKQVMITLKQEFSKLFSEWFSILVSDSLTATLDDDFSPLIQQQDYELDYSFLSGGERTAIALAYRLSLNQVINSLLSNLKTNNLVILDEPTDGFSSQQLDKMRDVLNQLNTEQLIIVSHEPKIEGFVDNIIRVRKEGGISQVEG